MSRRILVNAGLGVLVLGLGVAGLVALFTPRQDPYANLPTTKVLRGTLAATVTASGNVESGITASLQMPGAGGVITRVYVKTGSQVNAGDRLVRGPSDLFQVLFSSLDPQPSGIARESSRWWHWPHPLE